MKILKILPLLFLVILLGCIQQPTEKTKEKSLAPTYGLSVDISGGNITITKGSRFSLMISIKNNGDFDAILKKIWLLGDILYIDGEVKKTPEIILHKREVHVETFSPLTVTTTLGKKYFEFYPAVCYYYSSTGKLSFSVTTNDQIFIDNKDKPLKKSSSNSPLLIDFEGFPIYKLTESEGVFLGAAHFNVKVLGKNPNSWPVASCDSLSDARIENFTLYIHVPSGLSIKVLGDHWIPISTSQFPKIEESCIEYCERNFRSCNKSCWENWNRCFSQAYNEIVKYCNQTVVECLSNEIKSRWEHCTENITSIGELDTFCIADNLLDYCGVGECVNDLGCGSLEHSLSTIDEALWYYCINDNKTIEECEKITTLTNYLDDFINDFIKDYRKYFSQNLEKLVEETCNSTRDSCLENCNQTFQQCIQGCPKVYIYQLNNSYYSYLRSRQSLRNIPLSIEINSSSPIDISEILVRVEIYYNFYEIFSNKKAVFEIV